MDGIFDFENIEGAVARLIIDEANPYIEADIAFKEGHECLGYMLIRTPPLSAGGFEAIPAEAIAVAGVALGERQQNPKNAEAIQQAAKQLTGLDIGREIFANIEQVNLFLLPPGDASATSGAVRTFGPFLYAGLAITSRDPSQTYNLIDTLLAVVDVFTSGTQPQQSDPPQRQAGRYRIVGGGSSKAVHCYLGRAGRSTIVALDERVLEASLAAVKTGQGALAKGPLHPALTQLPGGTSKLILANAGGAIQLADALFRPRTAAQTQPGSSPAALGNLVKAFEGTALWLHTVEKPNQLTARLSVSDLPPLGDLFPLIMQYSQETVEFKGGPRKKDISQYNALPPVEAAKPTDAVKKLWTFEDDSDQFLFGRYIDGFAYTGGRSIQLVRREGATYDVFIQAALNKDGYCTITDNSYFNIAYYSEKPTEMKFMVESPEENTAVMIVELEGGKWRYLSLPIKEFIRAEGVIGRPVVMVMVKGGEVGSQQVVFVDDMSISEGPLGDPRIGAKPLPRRRIRDVSRARPRKSPVVVDGRLDEWGDLPFDCTNPAQIAKYPQTWAGPDDCSFKFAVEYDEKFLYVAAKVIDDKLHPRPGDEAWRQDGLSIYVDTRPAAKRTYYGTLEGEEGFIPMYALALAPQAIDEELQAEGAKVAAFKTDYGYTAEIAVPVSYLDRIQGKKWVEFRMNVMVIDFDAGEPGEVTDVGSKLYWRRDWRYGEQGLTSGTFIRQGAPVPEIPVELPKPTDSDF